MEVLADLINVMYFYVDQEQKRYIFDIHSKMASNDLQLNRFC